ncbi:hypothetical protein D1007_55584 [Hordeum vulgare]|nr:hypothetical protein D1007_55584 [Hordeum vulgare]
MTLTSDHDYPKVLKDLMKHIHLEGDAVYKGYPFMESGVELWYVEVHLHHVKGVCPKTMGQYFFISRVPRAIFFDAVREAAMEAIRQIGEILEARLRHTQEYLSELEVDFRDAEVRLAAEHVRLATRWCQLETSTKEAQGKAEAIRVEGQREAVEPKAARASSLVETEALAKRWDEVAASLKVLQEVVKAREAKLAHRDSDLEKLVAKQVVERRLLEALQCKVVETQDAHAKQVSEANTKLATREEEIHAATDAKAVVDRAVLGSTKLGALQALSSTCRLELDSPFIEDATYTEFFSELVKELEGTAKKVDNKLEEECHDLFSMAATRIFSHILLCDPRFEFEEVMGPVPEQSCGDLAIAMEDHVNMLLGKFFCGNGEEPC